MRFCVLCHVEVHLDDVWLPFQERTERCICLGCFIRVTGIRNPCRSGVTHDAGAVADAALRTSGGAL